MSNLLNLSEMPEDPIRAIMWLSGVKKKALAELDRAFEEAYFEARFHGLTDSAIEAGPYAKKRVLAMTRRANNRRGRSVRWGDGLDATSTTYKG